MKFLTTPFGLATLACTLLAGWALWTGGILDGAAARQVRHSSVYAAPGVPVDRSAAERVIGNRRLVVLFLPAGADLRKDGCDRVRRAADRTLVLALSPSADGWKRYGCALFPGAAGKNLGKAAVAESVVGSGLDQFAGRPVEALKVVVVNYDRLVKADLVPDGGRTISPSLPRYLIAAAAVLVVLLGSVVLWLAGRRAGRLAVARRERLEAASDSRSALSAAVATLAQQIIDLDGRAADARYRRLTSDYLTMLDELAAARDGAEAERLKSRVETMIGRGRELAVSASDSGPPRRPARRRSRSRRAGRTPK